VVPSTYFKKLVSTENIWECRIQHDAHTYRFFCFFDSHGVVVLTHGLMKKTQKTPQWEIERAAVYRREYVQWRVKP
jgi:phage-related protein